MTTATRRTTGDAADRPADSAPGGPAAGALGPGGLRRRAAAAFVLAVAVTAAVAWWGARGTPPDGPLVDTGATAWLLPAARILLDIAAVAVVGCLLAAAFLVPGEEGTVRGARLLLSEPARGWARAASWAAVAWAATAAVSLVLTLSDLLGVPPTQALDPAVLLEMAVSVQAGRGLTVVALLAVVIAVAARRLRSLGGAALVAALAVVAATPPVFTGHAEGSTLHELAVSTLLLHVVGALLWTGGLLALLLGRRRPAPALAASVRRFSRLALACFAATAVTGLLSAALRLERPRDLLGGYGLLLAGKLAGLLAAGGLGWWHRRASLPALAAGRPGVFARVAWLEAFVLAATVGLAAGLARTAPPGSETLTSYADKPLERLLYWLPDPLFLTAAGVAVGWYVVAARRLAHTGRPWPVARTALWVAGWLVLVLAATPQLGRSTAGLLPLVDRFQHFAVVMVVAPLLVAGHPHTLARRAAPQPTEPGMRGLREWLGAFAGARATVLAAHPSLALLVYAIGLTAVYVGVVEDFALRSHAGHLAVLATALGASVFVTWLIRGGRPPRPLSRRERLVLVGGSAGLQAFLVLVLLAPVPAPDTVVAAALLLLAAALGLLAGPPSTTPGTAARGR